MNTLSQSDLNAVFAESLVLLMTDMWRDPHPNIAPSHAEWEDRKARIVALRAYLSTATAQFPATEAAS